MRRKVSIIVLCALVLVTAAPFTKSIANNRIFLPELYVEEKTIVSQYVDELKDVYDVTVSKDGESVADDAFLGTGMNIEIVSKDSGAEYSQVVIVYGDVTGDGLIKTGDYMRIKRALVDSSLLIDEYFEAGDVTNDGILKAADYMRIKRYIIGETSVLPKPPQTPTPMPTPSPTPGYDGGIKLPDDN